MKLPERSPLYSPQFSSEKRRAIQAHNLSVIQESLTNHSFKPGTVSSFELDGLIINDESAEATELSIFQMHTSFRSSITQYGGDKILCSRSFFLDEYSHWLFNGFKLNTRKGFEGNGLARALILTTENIILPSWIAQLSSPQKIISLHKDTAHGAESHPVTYRSYDNFRYGWTGGVLSSLGYSNSPTDLKEHLGSDWIYKNENSLTDHWIKVLRE